MAAGYFLIAILGCADGSTQCTPVMTVPTRYESQQACEAATVQALTANSNFDFPSLVAECPREAPRAAAERARDPPPAPETRRG